MLVQKSSGAKPLQLQQQTLSGASSIRRVAPRSVTAQVAGPYAQYFRTAIESPQLWVQQSSTAVAESLSNAVAKSTVSSVSMAESLSTAVTKSSGSSSQFFDALADSLRHMTPEQQADTVYALWALGLPVIFLVWQQQQKDRVNVAMTVVQQEKQRREVLESTLVNAESRRDAAEAKLRIAEAEIEAMLADLASLQNTNNKVAAILHEDVAPTHGKQQQRQQSPAKQQVPAKPVVLTFTPAEKLMIEQAEKKRAALKEELQMALARTEELKKVLDPVGAHAKQEALAAAVSLKTVTRPPIEASPEEKKRIELAEMKRDMLHEELKAALARSFLLRQALTQQMVTVGSMA